MPAKLERCVKKVSRGKKSLKSKAYAICTSSINKSKK